MPVYAVAVEECRYATIYVEADTEEQAEAQADELVDTMGDRDWADSEVNIDSVMPYEPEPGDEVWRGGDEGEFVTVE